MKSTSKERGRGGKGKEGKKGKGKEVRSKGKQGRWMHPSTAGDRKPWC